MRKSHAFNTAPLGPKPKARTALRDPILDYLLREYADHYAFHPAAAMLKDMLNEGVTLTHELVDYAIKASQREGLSRLVRKTETEELRANLANRQSRVYFVQSGNRIKIGTSVDPERRVKQFSLTTEHLIATMPGGRAEEAAVHQAFAKWRIPGTEWFRDNPDLQDYIRDNATSLA